MYGILCATPEELDALRAVIHAPDRARKSGPTKVWLGTHEGSPVALVLAGMGKVNAAAAATLLLSVFEAKALIFSGVAGGLNPELSVGDVLLADRLAIHDYGIIENGRFTPTQSGGMPIGAPRLDALTAVDPKVAANLARLAAAMADKVPVIRLGGVVTADYFLACGQTRESLRQTYRADAIDMESGAVQQIARAWGAPLYVIRTLSDLAGEDSHIGYKQMAAMAARNSALCVGALLAILDDR